MFLLRFFNKFRFALRILALMYATRVQHKMNKAIEAKKLILSRVSEHNSKRINLGNIFQHLLYEDFTYILRH
jgi:hypothetical protein